MNINDIAERGNNHARNKGFYFDDAEESIFFKILEENDEFRFAMKKDINHMDIFSSSNNKDIWIQEFESSVKNSTGDELADIIITAAAGAKELGIDIEKHISAKMKYNELRDDHK